MQITKTFNLPYPIDTVWRALSDVHLVGSCLPGAAVQGELGDDRYKGRFSVKVGPLAATFGGEVGIQRDAEHYAATVIGKGADPRSSSRASGSMTYRLVRVDKTMTRVDVDSTLNLAGALAQFGKAGVIQEIANRITASFIQNLQARLPEIEPTPGDAPTHAVENANTVAQPQEPPAPMDAGRLFWSVLRDTFLAWLRRLFGRSP